jgi:peroxiredoxin Q/BCP
MAKLAKGDQAPAFELLDQHGKQISSKDFSGRKLLIYFYPKANTSG